MKDKTELQHKYHFKTPVKSLKRKKRVKFVGFCIVTILLLVGISKYKHLFISEDVGVEEVYAEVVENDNDDTRQINKSIEDEYNIQTYVISEGDIPADIFEKYANFDANDVAALVKASEDVFDITHLKIGQEIRFLTKKNSDIVNRIEYDKNTETKIVIENDNGEFKVKEEQIQYDIQEVTVQGVIDEFFYKDALESGMSESTVMEVADLFAFDVDFMTDIKEGDKFTVIYEKRTLNGESASDGKVLAAKFVNKDNPYYAYYFAQDSVEGYYDGEGHLLEKQFLRAPLSYRRISSGFTNARYHPITKKVTAHQQVDYAAPTGTPVVAAASGVITQASYAGGWGNMIRMKHDNGYTTHYGHLSGFADGIKSGVHVERGQLIGYVGSTGWSTGPHLDYGIKLNGTPINPLSFVQPKGEKITDSLKDAFYDLKDRYVNILN